MENYLVKNVIKKNSGENHKHNDNEIGIALYYITIKDLKILLIISLNFHLYFMPPIVVF